MERAGSSKDLMDSRFTETQGSTSMPRFHTPNMKVEKESGYAGEVKKEANRFPIKNETVEYNYRNEWPGEASTAIHDEPQANVSYYRMHEVNHYPPNWFAVNSCAGVVNTSICVLPKVDVTKRFPILEEGANTRYAIPEDVANTRYVIPVDGAHRRCTIPEVSANSRYSIPVDGAHTRYSIPEISANSRYAIPGGGAHTRYITPEEGANAKYAIPEEGAHTRYVIPEEGANIKYAIPEEGAHTRYVIPEESSNTKYSIPEYGANTRYAIPVDGSHTRYITEEGASTRYIIPEEGANTRYAIPEEGANTRYAIPGEDVNTKYVIPVDDAKTRYIIPEKDVNRKYAIPEEGANTKYAAPEEGPNTRYVVPEEGANTTYAFPKVATTYYGMPDLVPRTTSRVPESSQYENLTRSYSRHVYGTDLAAEKPFRCDKCYLRFELRPLLHIHEATEHPQHRKPHKCPVCRKRFKSVHPMILHQKLHESLQHLCQPCGKYFRCDRFLRRHIDNIHGSEKRSMPCHWCADTFGSKEDFKAHISERHKEMTILGCEECGETFAKKIDLISHQEIHSWLCDRCQKMFPTKDALASHVMTHVSDKPFKCSQCPSTFRKMSCMLIHVTEVHTFASDPYKCKRCEMTFPFKTHLLEHEKLHSWKKLLVCQYCKKGFFRQSFFQRHLNTHVKQTNVPILTISDSP